MWSSLTISSPPQTDAEVISSSQVDVVTDDSFFEDLLKSDSSNQTDKNKVSAVSEDKESKVNQEADQHNDDSENEWDVDDWGDSSTPVSKRNTKPVPERQPFDERRKLLLEETTNGVMKELKEYMLNFADHRATLELNEDLNEKSFSSLISYYMKKPELADYTIEHEVPRMHYEVCCGDGSVVKKDQVDGEDKVRHALKAVLANEEINSPSHILIRMANQSLLADFLSALHEYLIKPELHTAVVVGDVSFNLDLENLLLVCDAVFEVSTISDSSSKEDRILLGTLPASITVAAGFAQDLVYEFKRPKLRIVLDHELRRAASGIALQRIEEIDISYNNNEACRSPSESTKTNTTPQSGGLLSYIGFGSAAKEHDTPVKQTLSPGIRLYNLETPPKVPPSHNVSGKKVEQGIRLYNLETPPKPPLKS